MWSLWLLDYFSVVLPHWMSKITTLSILCQSVKDYHLFVNLSKITTCLSICQRLPLVCQSVKDYLSVVLPCWLSKITSAQYFCVTSLAIKEYNLYPGLYLCCLFVLSNPCWPKVPPPHPCCLPIFTIPLQLQRQYYTVFATSNSASKSRCIVSRKRGRRLDLEWEFFTAMVPRYHLCSWLHW